MHWFYAHDGMPVGPVEETEFKRLVRSGVVGAETLVWREGMADWLPLGAFAGYTSAPGVRFGGFWIRTLARLIDGFVLSALTALLILPLAVMLGVAAGTGRSLAPSEFLLVYAALFLISVAVSAAYETYFVSARGATPGKMALGLKVVRAGGAPVPVGRAFGRYLAQMLSGFFMIGYLMAAFDAEKRALHDRICETRVVHAR